MPWETSFRDLGVNGPGERDQPEGCSQWSGRVDHSGVVEHLRHGLFGGEGGQPGVVNDQQPGIVGGLVGSVGGQPESDGDLPRVGQPGGVSGGQLGGVGGQP